MQTNVTTEQLRAWADQLLLQRSALRRSLPGLNLFPRFVDCDGPRLQLALAFDTKPWMSNPMGVVHGGVTAILMDTAMGILCCCLCGSSTPTISMTLNYPRPIPLNATVHIRSQLVVFGRTSSQVQAELFLPEAPDRVLAFATGVYSTKDRRDFAPPQP